MASIANQARRTKVSYIMPWRMYVKLSMYQFFSLQNTYFPPYSLISIGIRAES